jgi:hypothetical protein
MLTMSAKRKFGKLSRGDTKAPRVGVSPYMRITVLFVGCVSAIKAEYAIAQNRGRAMALSPSYPIRQFQKMVLKGDAQILIVDAGRQFQHWCAVRPCDHEVDQRNTFRDSWACCDTLMSEALFYE